MNVFVEECLNDVLGTRENSVKLECEINFHT